MVLSKKSLAESYFNEVISRMKHIKIKAVFTLHVDYWNNNRGFKTYFADSKLYILFENNMCLVITYYFIDSLKIELRELFPEEKARYENVDIKDFFNSSNDIYDFYSNKKIRNERCCLVYDYIKDVVLRTVTNDYSKWLDDGIGFVSPTDETFDEIKIVMNNGKSIIICADDAEADGYVLAWSEDIEETIVEYE